MKTWGPFLCVVVSGAIEVASVIAQHGHTSGWMIVVWVVFTVVWSYLWLLMARAVRRWEGTSNAWRASSVSWENSYRHLLQRTAAQHLDAAGGDS